MTCRAFCGSSVGKESTWNAGEPGSTPGLGRFPWRRDRLPIPVFLGFPGGSDGKESTCNVGDLGLIPGLGRSPGERNGNPLQYSCLGNPIDKRGFYMQRNPMAGYSPWDFPGKSTGVGCHFFLQEIFPTQGSNPGLLHCRQILYRLSYQGSPSTFRATREARYERY